MTKDKQTITAADVGTISAADLKTKPKEPAPRDPNAKCRLVVNLADGSGKVILVRGDEEIPLHNVTAVTIDSNGNVHMTMFCHAINADVQIATAQADAIEAQNGK